jgi:predicted HAD superfamily phosphohydrolase
LTGVRFTFANDTVLLADLGTLSPDMVKMLAVHGLSQKLGDSYASSETVAEAIESATGTMKNLQDGNFNARVQGSGGILAEAVARLKGIPVEQAQEMLAALDEEARLEIAKKPQVKATIDVIKGEKAIAKLDGLDDVEFDLPKVKKAK